MTKFEDDKSIEWRTPSSNEPEGWIPGKVTRTPNIWLVALLLAATATLIAYGWHNNAGSLLFVELLIGIAAIALGALFGFLFGIPRAANLDAQDRPADERLLKLRYQPSTNLEQVSDWLTKILIGVGLVQIREIGASLSALGLYVQSAFGESPTIAVITQVVVLAFLVIGFMLSFLWTRIYYGPMQTIRDSLVLNHIVERLSLTVESMQVRLDTTVSDAQSVKNITTMLARGELKPPSVPIREQGLTSEGTDRAISEWPDDLRGTLAAFERAPAEWDSDPAADLFQSPPGEADGYRLEAIVDEELDRVLVIRLSVIRLDGRPIEGIVTFVLHPTLAEPVIHALPKEDRASAHFPAGGWFTSVAILNAGNTVLSLDLREMPDAPEWFKED